MVFRKKLAGQAKKTLVWELKGLKKDLGLEGFEGFQRGAFS